jgi:hypothetical protein
VTKSERFSVSLSLSLYLPPPSLQVRGYSSQIMTPMWLDKITELLGQQYTVGQLLTDIQLIFSNCDKFNQVSE